MPCEPIIRDGQWIGFVCSRESEPVRLGRGVWMTWDSYFGPTIYTRKDRKTFLKNWERRPRVVAMLEKWQQENDPRRHHDAARGESSMTREHYGESW